MLSSTRRIALSCFALTLVASLARASQRQFLIEGPIPGGVVEFGVHDDFANLEGCGATCFAPGLFQVNVTCDASDSPVDVALRIASTINADALAQAEGFSATASARAGGAGLLSVRGPRDEHYHTCANFLVLEDGIECCPFGGLTPGGTFTCVTGLAVPTMGEWALVLLAALLLGAGVLVLGGRPAPARI